LNNDDRNSVVLRARGDVLLSVGDHAAAVDDYEVVVQSLGNIEDIEPSDRQKREAAGAYNNLSWVLATSPVDSVRDGKRALKYGEKAARLTDYKAPHILSTLAAAYAEAGDFEKAVEWSSKAVDIGAQEDHNQLEQLQEELDSYKAGEAWREKQESEENDVPLLGPEDLIDT
jgi:tetratricopeptide (TPR) repeat protein